MLLCELLKVEEEVVAAVEKCKVRSTETATAASMMVVIQQRYSSSSFLVRRRISNPAVPSSTGPLTVFAVSQARDDRRGEAVMDNYAANHPPACQDAIIVGLKQRLQVRADAVMMQALC